MPKRLRISMSARAVVAFREPFLPRGEEFADPGVALDEITSLRTSEPAVLRVAADGGKASDRKMVEGDWLCDDGGRSPKRIPPWNKRTYVRSSSPTRPSSPRRRVELIDLWESPESSPQLMMSFVLWERVTPETFNGAVRAACACARRVLGSVRSAEGVTASEAGEAYRVADAALTSIERMVRPAAGRTSVPGIDQAAAAEHLDRMYDLQRISPLISMAWVSAMGACRSATGHLIAAGQAVDDAVRDLAISTFRSESTHFSPIESANAWLAAEAAMADEVRAALPLLEVLRAAAGQDG